MPVPTHGGYDWMPAQPVNVEVLPAVVEVQVTTMPPVIDVNVTTMPPVINVNIESAVAAVPVTVDSITGDVNVVLPAAGETRDILASQITDVVGSMLTADRKGKIFMAEGFESGMGCWSTDATADAFCWPSRATRKNGLQALAATIAHFGHEFTMQRYIGKAASSKIGFELSFSTMSKFWELLFYAYVGDGTNQYRPGIWLTMSNGKLYYFNASCVWTQFATLPIQTYDYIHWHTIKYTFDIATSKYISLLYNGKIYDLSALSFGKVPVTAISQKAWINLQGIAGVGAFEIVYLDDIMLTEEV